MDSSKLKAIFVFVIAMIVALYLGVGAATAQFETIGWVLAGSVFAVCLLMGRRIWLLIPFLGSLHLTLMIPGRPTTILLAECLVIGFCTMMLLVRRLPFRLRFTELELWIGLLVICVLQVYLRNPIGVNLFGGSQIGGRPYILFGVAMLASIILTGLLIPANELKTALKLSIVGGILNLVIGILGSLWMPLGYYLGIGGATQNSAQMDRVDPGQAGRVKFAVFVPITLARWVSSFANPLRACFSPKWAPLILFSLGLAALSGYRNVVASVGLTYIVGLFYWGGFASVLGSILLGVLALGLLAAVNIATPLPPNVQRALSPLPGSWDSRYVHDAESSTEWRVEMWKEVLLTDRWIDDKIFGDGLGFSARELQHRAQLESRKYLHQEGTSGFDMEREYVLVTGNYHSGPVSAIRTIGYVGLAVMVIAMLRLMVHAHRQILRCRGTKWFPVALFFCIPIIWHPVFFIFVFGGFQKDAVLIMLNAGMLRMLENNLPLPAYLTLKERRHVSDTSKPPPVEASAV